MTSALRIGDRQRPQQHRVDQAEDRRVRADAQRQRQDGDEAESGALDEHPEGVFEVLKEHVSFQSASFAVSSCQPGAARTGGSWQPRSC